jgi:hypothetical protein
MEREPDVEIAATVRAEELRFECKPDVRVTAYSNSPASAESLTERENLPDELEPGVSYRNFAVRWHVAARLDDSEPTNRCDTSGTERRPMNAAALDRSGPH